MDRPTIIAEPGRRPWIVDSAQDALLANYAVWGLFQRAGMLMRVVALTADETEKEKRIRRAAGTLVLRQATVPMIEDILGRAIRWRNTKNSEIDCPTKVASIFLSRAGLWRLPELIGIIEAPVMRSDGSILSAPGYDPATGLLLQSHIAWPALPAPSLDAAKAALTCLTAPFKQFPFATPAGWSVLVSAILTGIQRRLIATAPAHAFDASTQGSGKSLLGDTVALIVAGHNLATMSANRDEEELRKKLMSVLIAGDAIVGLDNITKPLHSDALASILTLEKYQDRILGASERIAARTNALFILTGNNLSFSGDMPSRVIGARIEPNCERPEERSFAISNLRAYVLDRRSQLVSAALTILQSYYFAGRPVQPLKPFGRFEQWSDEIRSAIVWAGLPDPCMSRDEIIASDPERDNTLAVLENWSRVVGEERVTLHTLSSRANDDADLKSALLEIAADTDHGDKISSRRLAAWCRVHAGRVIGDYKLSRAGEAHAGFKTWQVVRIDTQKQTVGEI